MAPVSPIVFQSGVAGAPSSEQTFHIFYYLFADAATEERQHMQLLEKTTFQYLGHRGIPGVRQNMRDDDAQRFERLKLALKMLASPNTLLLRPVS